MCISNTGTTASCKRGAAGSSKVIHIRIMARYCAFHTESVNYLFSCTTTENSLVMKKEKIGKPQ